MMRGVTPRRRAPAMSPEQRRAAIVSAALPLLTEHGAAVTTGQIATAAGVAEGTVFRAFADKHELMWACVHAAFDPVRPVAALRAIAPELPLAERLLRASAAVGEHWDRAMQIAHAVRSSGSTPPDGLRHHAQADPGEKLRALSDALADVLAPDAARLRLSPQRTARFYLLAVTGDRMLRSRMAALGAPGPADLSELIDIFLHGALRGEHE